MTTKTEQRTNEAVQSLTQATYDINQTLASSAATAQERSIQFTQQIFNKGMDTLKNDVEATRNLLQQVSHAQGPQQALETVLESAVDAQKRNVAFTQQYIEHSGEVLKEQAEATRTLTQTLTEKTHEWQRALQSCFYVVQQEMQQEMQQKAQR